MLVHTWFLLARYAFGFARPTLFWQVSLLCHRLEALLLAVRFGPLRYAGLGFFGNFEEWLTTLKAKIVRGKFVTSSTLTLHYRHVLAIMTTSW